MARRHASGRRQGRPLPADLLASVKKEPQKRRTGSWYPSGAAVVDLPEARNLGDLWYSMGFRHRPGIRRFAVEGVYARLEAYCNASMTKGFTSQEFYRNTDGAVIWDSAGKREWRTWTAVECSGNALHVKDAAVAVHSSLGSGPQQDWTEWTVFRGSVLRDAVGWQTRDRLAIITLRTNVPKAYAECELPDAGLPTQQNGLQLSRAWQKGGCKIALYEGDDYKTAVSFHGRDRQVCAFELASCGYRSLATRDDMD